MPVAPILVEPAIDMSSSIRTTRAMLSGLQPRVGDARWVGTLFLVIWLMVVIDGLWTYASVKLIGQRVLPLTLVMWLVLIVGTLAGIVRGSRLITGTTGMVQLAWLMVCYLLAVSLYHAHLGAPVFPLWHGYFLYYFYLLFLPLTGAFLGTLNPRLVAVILISIGLFLAGLGVAQHWSNDLFEFGRIVSTESGALNLGFAGRTRANGLFAHSEDLGYFVALAAAIAVAFGALRPSALRVGVLAIVLLILAAGCYATLTRAPYLAFAASAVVSVVIARTKHSRARFLALTPIVLLILGLAVFFGRELVSAYLLDASIVFSSSSISDRLAGNAHYLSQLERGGVTALLFGRGWYFSPALHQYVPLDNGYLAILVNVGLVGLVLWLLLTWSAWRFCLDLSLRERTPVAIGLAATFATWLMLSVFAVVNLYQMAAVLLVACSRRAIWRGSCD